MTGFLPNDRRAPQHCPAPRKTVLSPGDAMRRNRVLPPAQCRDNRAKLANLRNLIAAAEREYRQTTLELDRLNEEGRVWLVVDLIHKTALATLDLGAAIMQVSGMKAGDGVRMLADGTQTFSDVYGGAAGVADGSVSGKEFARTLAQRALTHTPAKGAGAAYAKGTADLALGGWSGIDNITGAQGGSARNARTAEAGIEAAAGLIQRTADTVDTPASKRVGAAAQIAKAMASYNRELEGAFNRRLETSGNLMATKATFQATMQRTMARYRRDAAELEQLLEGCM
ncbi:hypothetical protein SAMN04488021_12043 [Paracoccus aminovorans]|uniref:Uncharacterized protein n=1 Tax=Paracoccus aminovorans TaxID=34004 RepID=A0A1I3B9C2_9RHOB|nr:hypothetical protein [Paracoccus aminovorans]CQR85384.1 hypothetical protein JCM7685_0804 [Paracoccus aminovorans]SFH58903.1 hypothetical protein SAMN04488021_12043 [Paracoccus aminovorans]